MADVSQYYRNASRLELLAVIGQQHDQIAELESEVEQSRDKEKHK